MSVHPQEAAYCNRGNVLFSSGQVNEAIAAYQRALELQPDRASTHYNLANAWLRVGRADEAIDAYHRALALRPDFPRAWNNLGNALCRLGRLGEAIDAYRKALDLAPDEADACNNLANALKDSGCPDQALALYERAVGLRKPGFERTLANKALLLMEMGEATRALQTATEALAVNPHSVPAWHIRSALKKFAPADADLEALEALLAAAPAHRLSVEDRIRLQFSLGKGWLDAGDAERAFAHLEGGNRLKRSTFEYDGGLAGRRMAGIAASFTPQLMQKFVGAGHPTDAPVFVVGMPRSGTTLVEQILASHPEVHGAGELRVLLQLVPGLSRSEPDPCPPLYPPLLAQLLPSDLTRLGRDYEARSCAASHGKRRTIDKMPANFLYAGFIHMILPNARIIHCRRDALDTCLSCYIRTFCGGVAFAYDLRELGLYYRHYEALTNHWRDLLPAERFTEVRYEDIVDDLEREARRLVAFCGLEWNDACLAFHQTRRQVRTASATEVRQPIYRSSVGRWKPYARHLGPLLAALSD